MDDIDALVAPSAELKADLVAFGYSRRFDKALSLALLEEYGPTGAAEEHELVTFMDRFLLQHRLPDGRTVLERFVRSRGELPAAERANRERSSCCNGGMSSKACSALPTATAACWTR